MEGREAFFVDDTTFDAMLRVDAVVERVQVYANRYATGTAWLGERVGW